MDRNSLASKILLKHALENKQAMDFSSIAPVKQEKTPLNPRELSRAIRLAIAAEHDAAHLYELIVDSTKDAKAKKVLQSISNEEKVHVGELEALLGSIDKENAGFEDEGRKEVEDIAKSK